MTTHVYRILVVDDDAATQKIVRLTLERANYEVVTVETAEQALRHIKRRGLPHLAVIDINLGSRIDGFELCHRIKKFSDLPIIILSADRHSSTIVNAIDLYAEDYVVKPFSPRELAARVRRVLHRIGSFEGELDQPTIVDDSLQINFGERYLLRDAENVPLTPAETKLLYILLRHARSTVSNTFLLERLWPLEPANESRLRVLVYRLRRKIEPDPDQPRYILSDRGTGYSFALPVTHEPRPTNGRSSTTRTT